MDGEALVHPDSSVTPLVSEDPSQPPHGGFPASVCVSQLAEHGRWMQQGPELLLIAYAAESLQHLIALVIDDATSMFDAALVGERELEVVVSHPRRRVTTRRGEW